MKPKKAGRHGALGFVENLGADVGHAALGIGPGLVQTVKHPIGTVKEIGKTYKQTYGPLAHGHLGKFLHNVYEHPLGPALDIATIATLGAGAGAKAGILAGDAGKLTLRSPAARVGQAGAKTITKRTSRNPVIRARQTAIHKALNRLPHDFPFMGETVRFGKQLDMLPRQDALRHRAAARDYNKAIRNLSNEEFAALHLIERGVHPHDYAKFLKGQDHVEPQMLEVLHNPKIVDLVDNPSKAIQKAMPAYEHLSRTDAELKISHGFLDKKTAEHRISQLERMVYGKAEGRARAYVPDVPVVSRVANADFARMGGGVGVARLPGSFRHNKGVLARTGRLALHPDVLGPEYLSTIKFGLHDDIHSELMSSAVRVEKGTPLPEGWTYLRKKVVTREADRYGGQIRKLEGLLRAQHVEGRKPFVEKYHTVGIQTKLGKLRTDQAKARKGRNAIVSTRSQQIHPLVQRQGEIQRSLSEIAGPEAKALNQGKDTFATLHESDAETLHGEYLIVPKRLTDQVAGEFHRSTRAAQLFLEKPTKVWRALVLGLRVGFLTNNVVGNHLLYALHGAGPDGLRAYLNAVKREHGKGMVKTLLEDKQLPPPLRQRFMDEFFPEQSSAGTFGKTQDIKFMSGKKGKKARAAGAAGILPATQAIAESVPRRALVETFIRNSPEFKSVYRAMPHQARDFEQAAAKVLRGEGGAEYQRMISVKVNHALGDYLGLSSFERHTIRAAVPFYSWYKAIATITAHLALDTPGRANLLSKIGQLGAQDTLNKLGSTKDYLASLVPIGSPAGGKQKVLSTGGLNPFQTDDQLIQGLSAAIAGKPGELGRAFSQLGPNPFLLGAVQALAGKNLFTGRQIKGGGPPGIPGQILSQVGTQLPQTQLAQALRGHGRPSKLYGKQSAGEAALQFLGAPVKKIDLGQAHR